MNLANVKKFIAALAAAAAEGVSVGLLTGDAQKWTVGIIAVAGAFLVYLVPNAGSKPSA